ncbi:hypothetical protein HanXRQr2_Chr17g0805191 [Helianthus annuus]|uniref:Uncharacterized protein n=1 Tax=Helianthus annuus TaxID=4232 RepID=A0A9K3DHU1_HELAN|nr:hypothetical protein HanXRQr2_Chr17g0805191 [Helianthus annuus]KAJ0429391.1 hypothetical protein HanHA300_Chr17g0656741 [Helianthus annuus]KAJ0636558.1 hypothetical protein HanOQP8_Chr17g0663241 [Helianthus annuus]KAJ0818105.1 hypothetical protein HanLR1_Chr00c0377g0745701 [Helianthus annuus]
MKFMCYLSYLRRITCDVLMICYIRSMEWIDQDEFVGTAIVTRDDGRLALED